MEDAVRVAVHIADLMQGGVAPEGELVAGKTVGAQDLVPMPVPFQCADLQPPAP